MPSKTLNPPAWNGSRALPVQAAASPRAAQKPGKTPAMRKAAVLCTAAGCAAAVTLGLFALMGFLIERHDSAAQEKLETRAVTFTRMARDETVKLKDRQPPPKPVVEPPPVPPAMTAPVSEPNMMQIAAPTPSMFAFAPDLNGIGAFIGDDIVPMVQVPPTYPQAMANKKVEGWVKVGFDVSPLGQVMNPFVVEAQPPDAFDDAAIAAIRKWRFRPMVIDGQPVHRTGVFVTIAFNLRKS